MEYYRMSLVISFVLELKGLTGMSFFYRYYRSTQEDGVVYGEKWMSVGNDGTSKMISLHSIYILTVRFVWLVGIEDEQAKFLIIPVNNETLPPYYK